MFTGNSLHIITCVSLTVGKWQLKCVLNVATSGAVCVCVSASQRAHQRRLNKVMKLGSSRSKYSKAGARGVNTLE